MGWLSLILIVIQFSISCAPESNFKVAPSKPTEPIKQETFEACYLGLDETGQTCLPTLELESVGASDLNYLDPERDSGLAAGPNRSQYAAPTRIIDLDTVDASFPLAPNFTLGEFMARRKGRYGLYSPQTVTSIQALRNQLKVPVRVNSGYRSPGYNAGLTGAAKWSRHQYGDAVDFISDGASIPELAKICEDLGASFTQTYTSHVHCDWRNTNLPEPFYGPVIRPTAFEEVTKLYREATFINEEKVRRQSRLTVNHPDAEDGEGLTYLWTVTSPSKSKKTYKTPQITLPTEPGLYKTEVTVGGSVTVSKDIMVPPR